MKRNLFLTIGLALTTSSLLLDHFLGIPDWIALFMGGLAIVAFVIHLVRCRKSCRI